MSCLARPAGHLRKLLIVSLLRRTALYLLVMYLVLNPGLNLIWT